MKKIGFLMSTKENEKRRALLPHHIASIKNKKFLFFESGYGNLLGYTDEDYRSAGANVVSKREILSIDVICDPKVGDASYLNELSHGKTIFGWVHTVQSQEITDILTGNGLTAIAWENMFEQGRHSFWRNNEMAGEASVLHAFSLFGKMPYDCKVALIGRGNSARGASRILTSLGADVTVYDRNMEKLLRKELGSYDVVVNAVLWDINRDDHLIYKEDLLIMKKPSMIIDVSCDRKGGIESSVPTSIENPTYIVDGVLHYIVDHSPALFAYTVSEILGKELVKYIDIIIEDRVKENEVLSNAIIVENGKVMDQKIIEYQNNKTYEKV
ncbi:N(5)-(carboxyethyl)ornithine synthase [Oceanobacillus sp. CF4.6]|uniref:N(5)-(carboxyethyl)ornithine synthase n=1 Tax=Oceanobacillus sp. CF4.6 TaxID=3373080 RepID=UPI003EE622F6